MFFLNRRNGLIIFTILNCPCFFTNTIKAGSICTQTPVSQTPGFVAGQTDLDYIQRASDIMVNFNNVVMSFFDRNNTESTDLHIDRFSQVLTRIDSLVSDLKTRYNYSQSVKQGAFLDVLTDIQNSLRAIYNSLLTRSSSAVMNAFKKNVSSKVIRLIRKKLDLTKKYLTQNELSVLLNIINNSDDLVKKLPSDLGCGLIIMKRFN